MQAAGTEKRLKGAEKALRLLGFSGTPSRAVTLLASGLYTFWRLSGPLNSSKPASEVSGGVQNVWGVWKILSKLQAPGGSDKARLMTLMSGSCVGSGL